MLIINPNTLKIANQNAVFMAYIVTFLKSNTVLAQMEHLSGYAVYLFMYFTSVHVEREPCHHSMACPTVAVRGLSIQDMKERCKCTE
jgi:hypothetical protein